MISAFHNLIPVKTISDALPALHDYNAGRQKPSGQPFDFQPTIGDTLARIGGIRTARDLAAQQARGAFIRQRDVYNADRTNQLQAYAQARTPAERASVREYILRTWNSGRPDVQKIDYGDLQKAATAFERKAKLSPSDLGLAVTKRTRPFAPNPDVYGFMPN
jgi:NADPH-dependent glutamate synthase beta subunit-like oxidoreductase